MIEGYNAIGLMTRKIVSIYTNLTVYLQGRFRIRKTRPISERYSDKRSNSAKRVDSSEKTV